MLNRKRKVKVKKITYEEAGSLIMAGVKVMKRPLCTWYAADAGNLISTSGGTGIAANWDYFPVEYGVEEVVE